MDDSYKNGTIRILRIIARLNIGGPAISAILLTHYFNDNIQTKLVVGEVSSGEESIDYLLEKYDVHPVYLNTLKRELSFLEDIKSIISVYKIIRDFKPHIIHTHTAKAGTIGRVAGILNNILHLKFGKKRIRIVHTFHGHVFSGYFNKYITYAFIIIERTLALFTDSIIVVSDSLKNELSEKYRISSDKKITAIYEGFDLEPFLGIGVPSNQKALQTEYQYTLLTVGRLVPIKGQQYLIEALSKLQIPSRLIIVGDGTLREELQELSIRLRIADRIEFKGNQKDVSSIYKKADIFVLSSLNEGAPVTIIEALASARPVIATNVGGIRDLLGARVTTISDTIYLCERGILIPPEDPDAIAVAITYLTKNADIANRISIVGREFAKKKFTIKNMIHNTQLIYVNSLK